MAITREDVRYMAALARLRFTPEEEARMVEDLEAVLGYMAKLNELDTDGVPPMSHVIDLYNVEREDAAQQRISHAEALKNAPDADGTYFRVPKVIE
ncbi:MAG: Asp-tRNA(Asn)/Glu-tRNA(Gln) amidotransferase subunit GatC [Rhodothermales bacterium]